MTIRAPHPYLAVSTAGGGLGKLLHVHTSLESLSLGPLLSVQMAAAAPTCFQWGLDGAHIGVQAKILCFPLSRSLRCPCGSCSSPPDQTQKVNQPILGHRKERTRKQTHSLDPRPETSSRQGQLQRITYRDSTWAKWTGQRFCGRKAPGLSLTTVQSGAGGRPGPISTDNDIRDGHGEKTGSRVTEHTSQSSPLSVYGLMRSTRKNPPIQHMSSSQTVPSGSHRAGTRGRAAAAEADLLRCHP
ncbi:hypothetical protein B0T18DRAFT_26609 [Schizothecium vesticola]|uniref:Uncharacterized protein n=1 Tax=Schizothecium vesticola TaxID=314040 RepID=A0AA40KCB7_9PEZI|nr:hypothetical protein B0T18DRAFT_26609 [Schizothecium vesticola]